MKNSYALPRVFWAGFSDGKIDLDYYECGEEPAYGQLYTNKRDALKRYQDVRRVSIMQCPPKLRRRSSTTNVPK